MNYGSGSGTWIVDPGPGGQLITGTDPDQNTTGPGIFEAIEKKSCQKGSVADPDPGSNAFLISGSGIRKRFFSGSRIPNPYFWELSDNFLSKTFYNSFKIGPNFFLQHFKNKIIINYVKFVATKKGMTTQDPYPGNPHYPDTNHSEKERDIYKYDGDTSNDVKNQQREKQTTNQ